MTENLLPCPFCGWSKNVQLETDFHPGRTKCNWSARVICLDCFGTAQTHGFEWTEEAAKNEAIAAWNRRAGKDINVATNADRIRSMSDKELATEITKNPFIPCRMCEYYNHKLGHCDARRDFVCVTAYAEALALDWLKQPVKEEYYE